MFSLLGTQITYNDARVWLVTNKMSNIHHTRFGTPSTMRSQGFTYGGREREREGKNTSVQRYTCQLVCKMVSSIEDG